MRAWGHSLTIASQVMRGEHPDMTGGAMFYHAHYVEPYWKHTMLHVGNVGDHLFYKHPKY